jgi:hypothetical protein
MNMRTKKERQKIERWDLVDNSIFELLNNLNPTDKKINWDIKIISEIRLSIQNYFTDELKICTKRKFYP